MRSWVKRALCVGFTLPAWMAQAAVSEQQILSETPRPQMRPASPEAQAGRIQFATATTLRPVARTSVATTAEATLSAPRSDENKDAQFKTWLSNFASRAQGQGIRLETLNRALDGVTYDASVIERDRNQSEFTRTIWDYLDRAASDSRVRNGKAALQGPAGYAGTDRSALRGR